MKNLRPVFTRTLPRDATLSLFDRMEQDETVKACFPDGAVSCREDFEKELQTRGLAFAVLDQEGAPHGFTWINRIQGRSAFIHFCSFSNLWGNPQLPDLARWCVQRLLWERAGAEFIFDVLFGLTPLENYLAIRFARKIASREIGEGFLPGTEIAGMLTAFTREGKESDYEDLYALRA